MIIQEFPGKMSELPVDVSHPNRCLIHGLFREDAGEFQSFLTYIPQDIDNCRPAIVICLPSGINAAEYLKKSGLKSFADKEQIYLHLLTPNKPWSVQDAVTINTVYTKVQSRDHYVILPDNIYLCGIGDAVSAVHSAAAQCGDWSGLMSFGEFKEEIDSVLQGTPQMPIWMMTESNVYSEHAVSYWCARNKAIKEILHGDGVDQIYLQEPTRYTSEVNEERIAQVRVCTTKDEFTTQHFQDAWRYIGSACRHRGIGGKQLRYLRKPGEAGAVKHTMDSNGMTRTWYEYVPESCTPDEKWPLVLVMHGRGGSAETFFDISGMSVVAHARKFIAVFPEAGIYQQKTDGLRNISLWCGDYRGEPIDDVTFIKELIADLSQRLPVDRSRIYACGQSSGGMMSDVLGHTAGELFAAVAAWSALRSETILRRTFPESICGAPLMWLFGENDPICTKEGQDPILPFTITEEMRNSLMEKLTHFGLDPSNQQCWTTDPISWCSFPNEEGIPLVVMGKVSNMGHANVPEESWISYDQFLSQFHREENGDLYYRGQKVSRK